MKINPKHIHHQHQYLSLILITTITATIAFKLMEQCFKKILIKREESLEIALK